MALILDTNAFSAFADGDRKLLGIISKEHELALPVIVLGEYLFGIGQSRVRAAHERWIEEHLPDFALLPIRRETGSQYALICSELKALGRPIPTNDIWIAALAREYGMSIATRDRHFYSVPGVHVSSW